MTRRLWLLAAALMPFTSAAFAQDQADLAKASQNPVADLISLPFQNNVLFGVGPDDQTANVLNIQPVVPIALGDWNLINRTIVPLIYLPDVTSGLEVLPEGIEGGSEFGLGDINYTGFLSPADSGAFTWGVGPSISIPTATDEKLGTEKWSIGPSVVGLVQPGPWVIGGLARHIWSFAGDDDRADVSQTLIQPFINYNLPDGWYLSSAPIITANWEADDDRWLVPVGGGGGRVFPIGKQPVNLGVQGYWNPVRPDNAPEASLRVVLTFLFPK
jgi:hypothetical protein